MSCFKKGEVVWDVGLRRVAKLISVMETHQGLTYETSTTDHHINEASCCDLRRLDNSDVGRRNRKIVSQIEKLIGQLR